MPDHRADGGPTRACHPPHDGRHGREAHVQCAAIAVVCVSL